jgi:amidohydrolase
MLNAKTQESFDFVRFRQQLHRNPELSALEINTNALIIKQLREFGFEKIYTGFSMYSILVEIDGKNAGPTVLFRCDMDALPIQEENDFEYRSSIPNVSHKCGHDGHSTIMLRFAEKLVQNPPAKGKVLLFFQSAEEIGAGAKAALESGFLDQFKIDYAFALHNIPGFELGKVLVKKGLFTPCVESGVFNLKGKTSHAAEPQKSINPALAIAEIINYFESIVEFDKNHTDYFIASPIHIEMGEKAYGTTAGNASIGYTFRTWKNDDFDYKKAQIIEKVNAIALKYQLELNINWLESFSANFNDEMAYEIIKKSAQKENFELIELEKPFEFGEDFGLFTKKYKGAMFGLGAGINLAPLHSATYDFPDELIEIGAAVFMNIVAEIA